MSEGHKIFKNSILKTNAHLVFWVLQLTFLTLLAANFGVMATEKRLSQKRVALVIGNSNYQYSPALKTPANDARDLAKTLRLLNFSVMEETNLDAEGFSNTMAAFSKRLEGADVALLYFAGHGLQFRGENYLVPVDARLKNEFTLKREAFPIRDIIDQMETKARINLIILEASRNNPLSKKLRATLGASRSVELGQGLGRIPGLTGDTLLVYAAARGAEALDGKDRNSPFMKALLKHISTPRLEIEVMLKRVARLVRKTTKQYQRPERLSRLTSEFYFNEQPARQRSEQAAQERLQQLNKRVATLRVQLKTQSRQQWLPELVAIKKGVFVMGCTGMLIGTNNCQSDEQPAHQVRVNAFFMTRTEITFAQYDACVARGGCAHNPMDQGWGRANRPVINISWLDAVAYAKWLSAKTGKVWRLPREAEWEYAARAGTITQYSFGDRLNTRQANFDYLLKKTTPVGQYPANQFGLYDMHGNVWEWVNDRYSSSWYEVSPIDNPKGPATGASRVFRGGSWLYTAKQLRASERNSYSPDFRSKNIGFRLVRE